MLLCERCQVYRADVQTVDGWVCAACAGLEDDALDLMDAYDEADIDAEAAEAAEIEEHDPECRCEACREAAREVQMLFDMGRLP